MKKHIGTDRGRMGTSVVAVMIALVVICSLLGTSLSVGVHNSYTAKRLADRVRAQLIAEAGVQQAYSVLVTNFTARTDPDNFPNASYGGGVYSRLVSPVGDNTAVIVSTGTYCSAMVSVIADCRNYGPLPADGDDGDHGLGEVPDNPYEFALCGGGDMTWVGNCDIALCSNGWSHFNGNIYGNGQQSIYGNLAAVGTVDFPNLTGEKLPGDNPVEIPSIDLTPYYNEALKNGQIYPSGKVWSGNVTITGGVAWVAGDMSFSEGTFKGCFIATGNITTGTGNNEIYLRRVNQYPVLVSRDGSINVQGGSKSVFDFVGLIYCKTGGFTKQGNGNVNGVGEILVAGDIDKNGGWSGMFYSNCVPVPPGADGGSGLGPDVIGISAWQK